MTANGDGSSDGSGRGSLRAIVGGSLEQIAAALSHLPLSVSRAQPSIDAVAMLRSKGFADIPPPDVTALHRQPWVDENFQPRAEQQQQQQHQQQGEGQQLIKAAISPAKAAEDTRGGGGATPDGAGGEYEALTAAALERSGHLSRLHTDNYLKAEAEAEWQLELETYLHTGPTPSRAPALAAPPCGFSTGVCPSFHGPDEEVAQLGRRWAANGRFMRLYEVVNTLNVSRWQGTGDSVAPLGSLADITDASYDYHEPRSSLVRGTPQPAVVSSRLGESVVGGGGGVGDDGLSGSHWYLCQINRMLHSVVSQGQPASLIRQVMDRGEQSREAWLVGGSLHYLSGEFRGVLAQAHNDRMDSVVGTPAGGGCGDEDLIYVRSHLLRYQHTCQFPREWHVDEWQDRPSGATHQVPLWAETLFLMRCASPAAESLFSDGQHFRSSGSSRATNGGGADEAAFNQSVRSVFAGALKQWSDSERGGGEGLHSLKLTPAQKGDFVRASTMREREGDTAKWGQSQYRCSMQFRQATQQDLWHKAVISILNDTDDSPGDFPTGEGGRGGGARNMTGTKRAINELPLLLGDSGEHLLTMMGIDPAADRLALAEFLQPVEQIRQINTAMLLQRSIWRVVQDYTWRQLVFVRPSSPHPSLSLEHCRTEGVRTVIDRVSKIAPSFRHCARNMPSQGYAASANMGTPSIDGSVQHEPAHAVAAQVRTVVSYNVVQLLLLTLQIEKAMTELAGLGGVHAAEAAHTVIGLCHYMASPSRNDRISALSYNLISKLLHTYLLPVYSGMSATSRGAGLGGGGGFEHMSPRAQIERALHYCLVMQLVPGEVGGEGGGVMAVEASPQCIELVAQVALSVPAREFHHAARSVMRTLCRDNSSSSVAVARTELIKKIFRMGRMRAAEVCRSRGDMLLKDAANLYYWADYTLDGTGGGGGGGGGACMQLDRYMQAITALMDNYANPRKCTDLAGRQQVMGFCSDLVKMLCDCSGPGRGGGFGGPGVEGEEGSLREQARDVMAWIQNKDTSNRNRTHLAVFLHTWQAAMAHDIMMSGMPLEALVEVYDVPSEGGGRPPQCAPVVRTLLRRAIPATSGGVGVGGGGPSFLSPMAGGGGVEETGEVSGNISFLPSLYHGVTAEIAFSEVERICSVCLGGGFLAAKNLVFDCIILTASCFAALRSQDHRGRLGGLSGSSIIDQTSSFSSVMSPSKKRRGVGMSDPDGSITASGGVGGGAADMLRSIRWHLGELQRLVDLLEARNLCNKDLAQQLAAVVASGGGKQG